MPVCMHAGDYADLEAPHQPAHHPHETPELLYYARYERSRRCGFLT